MACDGHLTSHALETTVADPALQVISLTSAMALFAPSVVHLDGAWRAERWAARSAVRRRASSRHGPRQKTTATHTPSSFSRSRRRSVAGARSTTPFDPGTRRYGLSPVS